MDTTKPDCRDDVLGRVGLPGTYHVRLEEVPHDNPSGECVSGETKGGQNDTRKTVVPVPQSRSEGRRKSVPDPWIPHEICLTISSCLNQGYVGTEDPSKRYTVILDYHQS